LQAILARCLEKRPDDRFHSAHDLALALQAAASGRATTSSVERAVGKPASRLLPWVLAVSALVIVAIVVTAVFAPRRTAPAPPLIAALLPPPGVSVVGTIALSPDGRTLAFAGVGPESAPMRLWLRHLENGEVTVLAGTDGASAPFWSPDSRSLGFFARGMVQRIDVAGGPPRVVAPAADPRGGTWGAGVIAFSPSGGDGIYTAPADGGTPTRLTSLDKSRGEVSHRWPAFLPGGAALTFLVRTNAQNGRLSAWGISLAAKRPKMIVGADSAGVFANGRLFFMRGNTIFAQPFDAQALALAGEPIPMASRVWRDSNTDGLVAIAASDRALLYRTGSDVDARLTWIDRGGARTFVKVGAGPHAMDLSLSPDGRFGVFSVQETPGGSGSLWMLDMERGTQRPFTGDDMPDATSPLFSPDGRRVVFGSIRDGAFDLYEKAANGSSGAKPLLKSDRWKFPESWSPDGRWLLYTEMHPSTQADLWVLPMDGSSKPFPFVVTAAAEGGARFSPDGRIVAFVSNETGREEVYVQGFPSGEKWQVSSSGGTMPVWRPDGRALYYIATDFQLTEIPMTGQGERFGAGVPRGLFRIRVDTGGITTTVNRNFAVSVSGDRFLVNELVDDARTSAISIMVNWPSAGAPR
jgi:Tol biopolymer transport system component